MSFSGECLHQAWTFTPLLQQLEEMEDLEHPEWDQTIEYAWAPSDRFKERLAAHAGMLLWIADMQISGRLQIKTRGQTRWRLLKLQFIGWNAFSKCTISPAAHRQSSWCFKSKRPLSITVVFHGLDVTNLLFYWKKKKKMNHVSAELCFAPRRSHRVLGSHGTNQLGSRLSHAKPQTVTANSCCHAGAMKGHFSADDVIICSLPNPFSGPCSEGHSRTVIFYQTPCCYLPLKMICSSNIVTVSNPERCSKEGDSYTANDKMAKI